MNEISVLGQMVDQNLQIENLNHFKPMFPFYNSWKHQKTFGVFSRGIKWEHWPEIG